MAYSTLSDFLKEFSTPDLARLTGDPLGQTIDSTRLDHAIANADAIITSYLANRFVVPFPAPVDTLINKISIDLAVANLFDYAYCQTSIPLTVENRRSNALNLLKMLQNGLISIAGYVPSDNAPPLIVSNRDDKSDLFDDDTFSQFLD